MKRRMLLVLGVLLLTAGASSSSCDAPLVSTENCKTMCAPRLVDHLNTTECVCTGIVSITVPPATAEKAP